MQGMRIQPAEPRSRASRAGGVVSRGALPLAKVNHGELGLSSKMALDPDPGLSVCLCLSVCVCVCLSLSLSLCPSLPPFPPCFVLAPASAVVRFRRCGSILEPFHPP